jgi:hypothetical protein
MEVMKMIELKVKKLVERGELKYGILKIRALERNELPRDYFMQKPFCYADIYLGHFAPVFSLMIHLPMDMAREEFGYFLDYEEQEHIEEDVIEICEGKAYTCCFFSKVLGVIEDCGKRLKAINEQIKKEAEDWHGIETIKI